MLAAACYNRGEFEEGDRKTEKGGGERRGGREGKEE